MVKANFRNKLDGNALDLSLMSLEEVPVKEISAIPKATNIDLSCNHLTTIPPAFCNLKQIVKLDLSRNSIDSLPSNFGELIKLQYLDLYNNKLKMLPISFSQLKALKWLDLKDNPLSPQLKAVAGDCLDAKQCQACAKKVVQLMENVQNELQMEKEKQLKREEELAALRKRQEEEENEQQRKAKKAAKERKKAKLLAEKQAKLNQQKNIDSRDNSELPYNSDDKNRPPTGLVKNKKPSSGSSGCLKLLKTLILSFVIVFLLIFGLFFIYTRGDFSEANIKSAVDLMWKNVLDGVAHTKVVLFKCWVWLKNDGVRILILGWDQTVMLVEELVKYASFIFEDIMKILSHCWLHLLDRLASLNNILRGS